MVYRKVLEKEMGSGGETPRHQKRWELGVDEWRPPETEQECLDYYQERIANSHARQLLPLQEDLAEWLNKTLGLNYITASNFIDVLDNGAILCHLAQIIQEKANEAIKTGVANGPVPIIKGPFFEKASRKSFFSRDNTEKFIQFCKQLGVHQNLLFETNDLGNIATNNLIMHQLLIFSFNPKYQTLSKAKQCLVNKYDKIPSLIENSKLITSGTEKSEAFVDYFKKTFSNTESERSPHLVTDNSNKYLNLSLATVKLLLKFTTPEDILELIRRLKVKYVTKAALRQCRCIGSKCDKLKVRKVGEGRYNIFGRNVFVRLLKGRHMMVRVGGGWDTLEHFMQRHDPCQGRIGSRPSTPAAGKGQRPYSALNSYDVHSTLHTPHSLGR
nr:growth arrest-specific protein 2 [Halyomorpha halys]